jgi:hypothetical protein
MLFVYFEKKYNCNYFYQLLLVVIKDVFTCCVNFNKLATVNYFSHHTSPKEGGRFLHKPHLFYNSQIMSTSKNQPECPRNIPCFNKVCPERNEGFRERDFFRRVDFGSFDWPTENEFDFVSVFGPGPRRPRVDRGLVIVVEPGKHRN